MTCQDQSDYTRRKYSWLFAIKFLIQSMVLACIISKTVRFVDGIAYKTNIHELYLVTPKTHAHLHFLNNMRLYFPELIFWNGIGTVGDKVFIICSNETVAQVQDQFKENQLEIDMVYEKVTFSYVEYNPEYPESSSQIGTSRLDDESPTSGEVKPKDPVEEFLYEQKEQEEIEVRLAHGEPMDNQEEAEILIAKRKKKYRASNDLSETLRVNPQTPGLLGVEPIKSYDTMKDLSINTGILYRIQGIQTLFQHNEVEPKQAEWIAQDKETGDPKGCVPLVGEFIASSVKHRKLGINPLLTAEETMDWKNLEYRKHTNKSVLWMVVPTEVENFYEIRNRNYPFSLLVWTYDVEEGEFVVSLETRRSIMRRYKPDGILRHRALWAFQMVDKTYDWEVKDKRPKFNILTKNSDRVYLYESKKRKCSILVIRNSAEAPYMPAKTDRIGRPLDMFYITRQDLTGKLTASIFAFNYKKSIVDIFAKSEEEGTSEQIGTFELTNRTPLPLNYYVFEDVPQHNEFIFKFDYSFREFAWVTIESVIPSFGVSPIIATGVVGDSTATTEIVRQTAKLYRIQDRITVAPLTFLNGSIMFQHVENYSNPFTALMEVTQPADRLYFDKAGNPRFFRLSLPGHYIKKDWEAQTTFRYDRIIELREGAMVAQISGAMIGSYGLRAFVRKNMDEYGLGVAACPPAGNN